MVQDQLPELLATVLDQEFFHAARSGKLMKRTSQIEVEPSVSRLQKMVLAHFGFGRAASLEFGPAFERWVNGISSSRRAAVSRSPPGFEKPG